MFEACNLQKFAKEDTNFTAFQQTTSRFERPHKRKILNHPNFQLFNKRCLTASLGLSGGQKYKLQALPHQNNNNQVFKATNNHYDQKFVTFLLL